MSLDTNLKIALVHFEVRYARPEENRARLLAENRTAAKNGAGIIVNPEMCLSGYGFESRAHIAPMVETADGPTVRALAEVAQEHRVYIAFGLAERDPRTDIYFNTALLIGPDGVVRARHRKITAESKWACPGDIRQEDTCDTPWGRIGMLVCSESYYSLPPRTMALRGVDLLLLPATWPAGNIDVRRLWRARAMENGYHLVGVNRCGRDRTMDCDHAYSCVFDPDGRAIIRETAAASQIFYADLPLAHGRLTGPAAGGGIAGRRPGLYHYLYASFRPTTDLTQYYGLPAPGLLAVELVGLALDEPEAFERTAERLIQTESGLPRLIVLPRMALEGMGQDRLIDLARRTRSAVLAARGSEPHRETVFLARPDEPAVLDLTDRSPGGGGPWILDFGPARIGLCRAVDFRHPELAAAMSKRGCDLAAVTGGREGGDTDLLSVKVLEKIAVAAVHPSDALWAEPPSGHDQWAVRRVEAGVLRTTLDTRTTRRKSFLERIDHGLLFGGNAGGAMDTP